MVQTDGERESVPSLHSMPAGLAIHFPPLKGRHHIDVPWYGSRVVWPGCRGSSQQRASWLYFCAVLIEMWARDLR